MKKIRNRALSLVLVLAVSFTMLLGSTSFAQAASYNDTKKAFEKSGDYIYNTVKEPVTGSVGGDWVMYGLGNAGYKISDAYIEKYVESVKAALDEGYRGTVGILHDKKFTEYARAIIGCTTVGIDATNVGGYDLTAPLADFVNIKWQGMNGPIWALIALDSGDYDVPKYTASYAYGTLTEAESDRQNSRQRMIDYILANQYADGGWNLQEKSSSNTGRNAVSDVDVTGMAMIALAPYQSQSKVKKAINKAIAYLSEVQHDDGGFDSWGTVNSESCAQAICGLILCGVNPNTDKRFIKNGNSVIDGLMNFYDESTGGFRHVNVASGGYEPTVNQMATEQAYYALALFYKSVPAKTSISKLTKSASGKLKVSWKKADINKSYAEKQDGKGGVSGYQIVLATNKSFTKGVKKVTVSGSKAVSKTVTGLSKGKTYYVKVRAYKTVNGKKVYGLYSNVLTKKV